MGFVKSTLWIAAVLLPRVVGQCDTNLNTIRLRELGADTSQQRTYTICPGTELRVGTLDPNNNNALTGNMYFQARPNLRINCGPEGTSDNNCTVIGGTVQIDGTDWLGNTDPPYNFVLAGFTFVDPDRYSFWGNMPGTITFFDCIWRVSILWLPKDSQTVLCRHSHFLLILLIVQDHTRAMAPILLDYSDNDSSESLAVSFVKSQFKVRQLCDFSSFGVDVVVCSLRRVSFSL